MYLTAHHVVASDRRAGINAFAHRHGGSLPGGDISEETIQRVAEECPGELIKDDVDLSPGGNEVRSYLDVVAPDGTPPCAIREALAQFERDVRLHRPPLVRIKGSVGIRLDMSLGLYSQSAHEFAGLRDRILGLLEQCERSSG